MSHATSKLDSVIAPRATLAQAEFDHAVRFYSDDHLFFDELTDFVRGVLRSREPVVMLPTAEHCLTIRETLERKGCNLERAPLLILDADSLLERFMVNDEPDPMRFRDVMIRMLARARGGYGRNEQRVTMFGEMVAVIWSRGNPRAAITLEELWNDLSRTQRISLICAYPTRFFEGLEQWTEFSELCRTHSTVFPDESYGALKNEDERLRAIAGLQLKARALDREVARHKEVETTLESEVKQRTAEIEQTRNQLDDLSGRLVHLRDQESRHVAQELHDSTAQLLSVLAIYVDLLETGKDTVSPAAAQLISRSNALVKQVLLEVRTLSYGLYPPTLDIIGIGSALEWYVTRFADRTGIAVNLEMPSSSERLPEGIEIAIFRLVQECLAEVHGRSAGLGVNIRVSRSSEGASLLVNVNESSELSISNSSELFSFTSAEMRERLRQLKARYFTVSDAGSSGVSVFFPIEPREKIQSVSSGSA